MDTRKEVAKIVGVSDATISRVKHIVAHGTPGQVDRIKQGGTGNSVYAVYREVRAKAPGDDVPPDSRGPPGAEDMPEEPPQESDMEQIKRYVRELKDPDIDRPFTPRMFLAEYEAFSERVIRGMEIYRTEPYTGIYPLLSAAEREQIHAYNAAMIQAIRQIDQIAKGNDQS